METLLRRLFTTPQVLKHYDEIIKDQLNNGIVEIVTQGEEPGAGKVHYLPHRKVIRIDKETTKIRVVCDASAKRNGPSLNNCLYAGLPLTPLILEALIRFRAHTVALTADIEKAFLNVAILTEHGDYLWFLWIDDILKDNPQLLVMRFARVVFGVSLSPFLLNATICFHLESYRSEDPVFVDDVVRSLYVDDLANSQPDQVSAYEFYTKLKSRFREGGFNVRKWLTNDPNLSTKINSQVDHVKVQPVAELPQEDQTFTKSLFHSQCTKDLPRFLGTAWDTATDQYVFPVESLTYYLEEEVITKRIILSSIAKIFDPLGILLPIFTSLKILFQEICKRAVNWDSPLGDDVSTRWKSILQDMQKTSRLLINRCYLSSLRGCEKGTIEIHGFADASDKAYGAVVYLRVHSGSSVLCSLVTSKTRVTPITGTTTPRSELLFALVLARLIASVRKALESTLRINKVFCWLDSEIALWWMTGIGREYKPFIQNRVLQIRELVSLEAWRHADIASCGCKASQLKAKQTWWKEPAFLKKEELWPEQKSFGLLNFELSNISQVKKTKKETTHLVTDLAGGLGNVIRRKDFSDLLKLLQITCHVLGFIRRTQKREVQPQESASEVGLEENKEADEMWIKHVQKLISAEGK